MSNATPHHGISITTAHAEDSVELTKLINAVIERGGSTAYEHLFTEEQLAATMLTGTDVICCVVARDGKSGHPIGFQALRRLDQLPDDIADIATYTRMESARRGIGSALFNATFSLSRSCGLRGINATIRADNLSGLAFYDRLGFVDHHVQYGVLLKTGLPVDRICKRFDIHATCLQMRPSASFEPAQLLQQLHEES